MLDDISDSDLVLNKVRLARELPERAGEIIALPDEFPGFTAAALRLILAESKPASDSSLEVVSESPKPSSLQGDVRVANAALLD